MVLLEDSRQQHNKHDYKHRYFAENGIRVNRCTLVCGDYQIAGDGSVAVDTKTGCNEVINDIQFKAITKKSVRDITRQLCLGSHVSEYADHLYHLIVDDDSERFPETEITNFCFTHKISDTITKEMLTLYTKRHGFFHRGLIRAKEYGVKLYILVEEDGVHSIKDVFRWVNPRLLIMGSEIIRYEKGKPIRRRIQKYPNAMKGQSLAKAMMTMEKKYGCTFVFTDKAHAGAKIIELLTRGDDNQCVG